MIRYVCLLFVEAISVCIPTRFAIRFSGRRGGEKKERKKSRVSIDDDDKNKKKK